MVLCVHAQQGPKFEPASTFEAILDIGHSRNAGVPFENEREVPRFSRKAFDGSSFGCVSSSYSFYDVRAHVGQKYNSAAPVRSSRVFSLFAVKERKIKKAEA